MFHMDTARVLGSHWFPPNVAPRLFICFGKSFDYFEFEDLVVVVPTEVGSGDGIEDSFSEVVHVTAWPAPNSCLWFSTNLSKFDAKWS